MSFSRPHSTAHILPLPPPRKQQVSLALGSQLDFLATFAELAGAPIPNKTLDSYSLVPVLLGQAAGNQH